MGGSEGYAMCVRAADYMGKGVHDRVGTTTCATYSSVSPTWLLRNEALFFGTLNSFWNSADIDFLGANSPGSW